MPTHKDKTQGRAWARIQVGAAALLALLLVAACSRTQFLYERADWMALQWVDGLVDADARQTEVWGEDFAAVLEQHRREQLPGLVAWLDDAAAAAESGLTEEALVCLRDQAGGLIEGHAALIVPSAVRVLTDLSPQQIDELARYMAERNDEYREDYLDADLRERETRRIARYTERVEDWTGSLTAEQRQLVDRKVQGWPDTATPWLDYRRHQQQQLLALLRAGTAEQELSDFLVSWWVELADRPQGLVDAGTRVDTRTRALILEVDATLSDRQRAKLVSRLRDLHRDLAGAVAAERLAASAPKIRRCRVST